MTTPKIGSKNPVPRPPTWRRWRIALEFYTPVWASTPADPEVIRGWVDARKPKVRLPDSRSLDEINEEVLESLQQPDDDVVTKSLLVFQYTDLEGQRVIAVRAPTLRAHVKDCARVLSAQHLVRMQTERAFSTKIVHGFYPDIRRYWVELRRPDGTVITKPDGEQDKFVRPRTGGSALKRLQYVAPPSGLVFEAQTLGNSIQRSDLELVFEYGGIHGYGGERSEDGGKYVATIVEVTGHGTGKKASTTPDGAGSD